MPSSHAVIACRHRMPFALSGACVRWKCVRERRAVLTCEQGWPAKLASRDLAEMASRNLAEMAVANGRRRTRRPAALHRPAAWPLPPGPCRLAPAAWPLPPGAFHQPGVARALAAPPQAKSSEEIESSPVTGRGPVKWSSAARLLRLLLDLDLDCACIPGRSRLLFIGFLSIDLREDL